ncbi:MAG: iron-containing alcohol dehydrogenase [Sphingobacteriaceae bacterium]|nr:iron-containing alcohol dehydrogenase [Sphingobacteriaceae bacterium]
MENFSAYNPTRIQFGRDCTKSIGTDAAFLGKKALIIIGKGSVKKNGVLDQVTAHLKAANVAYELFEGIKSNPEYQDADAAVAQAKAFGAEMIIAVGGGSVIDTAKAVCAGFYSDHSVWEFYSGKGIKPKAALPLLVVLTLAATGTEMNRFTVLQDTANKHKRGWGNELLYPYISYLDPVYTFSVPAGYTAYGIADLMAHTFELYFGVDAAPLSDHLATDIIKLAMEYGPQAITHPEDYDARANLLWLSTVALNGTLNAGKRNGDFGVHAYEHVLSVLFDIPHGAGLSIIYPAWMKHFYGEIEAKMDFMAERTLGSGKTGKDFIAALEAFYDTIGTPKQLSQWKIGAEQHPLIVETLIENKVRGSYFDMQKADYESILALMA